MTMFLHLLYVRILYKSKNYINNYKTIMNIKLIIICLIYIAKHTIAFTVVTKLINSQNAINLLVSYEMRTKKYEKDNNISRNILQKYIKKKHQSLFNDIQNNNILFTALCTIKRKNCLDEPTYLICNKGNCAVVVPMWNLYYSETIALISPYDALDACDKYYFPRQIADANQIYSIYNTSKMYQCRKSLL